MAFSSLDSGLTGPLFATERMRAVFSDRARLAAMLRTEAALARAQAGLGLAPPGLAAAIEAIEPDALDLAALGEATALAGVPAIPFVKAVQKLLPAELEVAFHKGATTQDILDTALVLQMRDAFELLHDDLDGVLAGLIAMAQTHRATPCAGRTYGQHAAPVTFGFKAAVWLAGIAQAAARKRDVRANVLGASLGGPVGTLAAMGQHGPAVLDAFAWELRLAAPSIAWHTRRAAMADAASWLAILIGALGKMAGDVASLASTEVAELAEPHVAGRGGSTAMPHKRNPVSATIILAAAAAAPGHVSTMLASMVAAHERPAGAWHAEWSALPSLFGLASGTLAEARRLAEGLEVDAARMSRNLDFTHGMLFADAAAAVMAKTMGRGKAHDVVEHATAIVRDTGQPLLAVLSASPDVPASVDRAALAAAFDLSPSISAAARFVDRASKEAQAIRATLREPRRPTA